MSAGTAEPRRISTRALIIAGMFVALVLAGFVSYYASASPDGLEYVAREQGFDQTAQDSASADSPLADYTTKGVEGTRLSGALAGITGTVLVLGIAGGAGLLLRRRSTGPDSL